MCKHMALNLMHPPEFEADPTSVTVVLRLGSAATPAERAWLVQTLAAEKEVTARPYSVGDYAADIDAVRPQDVALLVRAARGEVLSNATHETCWARTRRKLAAPYGASGTGAC